MIAKRGGWIMANMLAERIHCVGRRQMSWLQADRTTEPCERTELMQLHVLDWVIIVASLLICFAPALFFGKRAGKNTAEFFASGRSVPWWLAGISMVATTFSSDTPNWVTQQVRQYGVAGNWQWWAFVLTGVSTVFFFARLWRRSGVMTDLEFYEIRYSGKAASVVRGFRAIYLGLFFNCFIMGMVTLAGCKIANILFGMPPWQTILFSGLLNVAFAAHSGLWGVLVIDMIQFFIKMTAVVRGGLFQPESGGPTYWSGRERLGGAATIGQHARFDNRSPCTARNRSCRRSTVTANPSWTCCRTFPWANWR